jgi:TetR/AcrR family transcriptional repressor of nem operon
MATSRPTVSPSTATDILDIAEGLVQSRGFNGFSYADVSSEMGITKAALHYHFAGKAELGERLITRYTDRFDDALAAIDAAALSVPDRLVAYCDLYRATLRGQRMCLCGMLAAEYNTLGQPMRDAIVRFFDQNQRWLTALLATGRQTGTLRFAGPDEQAAKTIIAALEGGMLVARPFQDTAVLDAVIDRLLIDFAGDTGPFVPLTFASVTSPSPSKVPKTR